MRSNSNYEGLYHLPEVLTQVDKKVIEQHFGQIVHQFYSSTEGEIAATCELGNLHLNEEIMVIEKSGSMKTEGYSVQ